MFQKCISYQTHWMFIKHYLPSGFKKGFDIVVSLVGVGFVTNDDDDDFTEELSSWITWKPSTPWLQESGDADDGDGWANVDGFDCGWSFFITPSTKSRRACSNANIVRMMFFSSPSAIKKQKIKNKKNTHWMKGNFN